MREKKVFILFGKERGTKELFLKEILNSIKREEPSVEISKYFFSQINTSVLLDKLNSRSFFSKFEVLIVEEAELIKSKKEQDLIFKSLEKLRDKCLILLSPAASLSFSFEKSSLSLKKGFWELSVYEKFNFIKEEFNLLGYKILDSAIYLMIEMLEGDTKALKAYINSFSYFLKDKSTIINEELLSSWLSFVKPENTFSLFDSILLCDLESALNKAISIIKQGEDFSTLLSSLIWQFKRFINVICDAQNSNLKDALLNNKIFSLFQKSYIKGYKNYSKEEAKSSLLLLLDYEVYLRTYKREFHLNLLYMLLYLIINKRKSPLRTLSP